MLFKALHNLIEKALLEKGYARLGKWFVMPYDLSNINYSCSMLSASGSGAPNAGLYACSSGINGSMSANMGSIGAMNDLTMGGDSNDVMSPLSSNSNEATSSINGATSNSNAYSGGLLLL